MSEQTPTPPIPEAAPQSQEELVASLNATEADAMTALQAELATLKAKSTDLADQYLRAKADAENAKELQAEIELAEKMKHEQAIKDAQARGQTNTPPR